MARTALKAAYAYGLSSIPSETGPEDDAETFVAGAVLIDIGGSGYLGEASANPRVVIGVATEPGNNGASDGLANIRYVPALPHIVFEGSIDSAGGLGTGAIAATDRFAEYGLTEDVNGIWYIDKDKTTGGTNTLARIVGFKDAVGTVNGRVYFVFLSEATVYET